MTTVAKQARASSRPATRTMHSPQPVNGSVCACRPYAGELARHRVISADGCDYVVATVAETAQERRVYVTGAYPVQRGYLVMLRQPLYEVRSADADDAREQHEALVSVLAEAGVRIVRARRILAARQRAERAEAMRGVKRGDEPVGQAAWR
jgi:hypothetical protein